MPSTAEHIHEVVLITSPCYQLAKVDRQAANLYFVIGRVFAFIRRLITKINHLSANEKVAVFM
jgi:hypothetical protein